jgi:hypothetical protein
VCLGWVFSAIVVTIWSELQGTENLFQVLFQPEKTTSESYEVLKRTICDYAVSRAQSFKWYSHCKYGQTSVENFEHSYHLSSSWSDENVEKVQQVIYDDRWPKINVYNIVGLWYGTWWCLLTWGRLLQNLCPVCWIVTRNQAIFLCTRTCKIRPKSQKLPFWGCKRN